MTVFVLRGGELVVKRKSQAWESRGEFPTPMLSRMQPFESPVTGREITSWRERDRDMDAVGACDPRDLPRAPFEKREQNARRSDDTEFEWRG